MTPVAGDITHENMGVQDLAILEEMWKEVDIVVNIAATTNFDERSIIYFLAHDFVINFDLQLLKICILFPFLINF